MIYDPKRYLSIDAQPLQDPKTGDMLCWFKCKCYAPQSPGSDVGECREGFDGFVNQPEQTRCGVVCQPWARQVRRALEQTLTKDGDDDGRHKQDGDG